MKRFFVKRRLFRFIALCLIFSAAAELVYLPVGYGVNLTNEILNVGFENMPLGEAPEGFLCSGDGGSVTVEEYEGDPCVYLKNSTDGKYVMLSKNFDNAAAGVLNISFDFLQPYTVGDGVMLALYQGGNEFGTLDCADGKIYLDTKTERVLLLEGYRANYRYTVRAAVNFASKNMSVTVYGETETTAAAVFSDDIVSCDKIGFYTNRAPGFYIDNLIISEQLSMDKITVQGTEIAVIPKTGVNEYTFSAYMTDKNGSPVENTNLAWEIAQTGSGFSGITVTPADAYGMTATLKVASDTTFRGIVKLKVTYAGVGAGENPPTAYYTVALENERVASVDISGPARITVGLKSEKRKYDAVAKDPYGKVIQHVDSTWSLAENTPDYVSLSADGVLTLSKEVQNDEQITLYADVGDAGLRAEKTVVLQSRKNYWSDVWRLNVLKSAADHVIEYGRDPYSNSPLLASGIDLRTKLPVEWQHSLDSEPGAFSDLAFDTGLYLVFDALSELTDDPQYTEKVDEIYQWYLDNGISDNMLGYWGGHTFIDLKTLKPFHAVPNPNTHEFKNTFFYFDPFYRLNTEKAYKMGMHIWLGHVYDWNTLITNRHAYYTKVHDESNWENLGSFSEDYKIIITRGEQPFRSMASDLVHTAGQMYAQTGDEKAKAWAMRILKCYYELADPETGIMPTVYTTARGAAGTLDPMESLEPKGAWYTREDLQTGDYTVLYGDRFFNQFAEDLVAQGFYPSSVLDEGDYTLTEGNYVESFSFDTVLNDLFFADMIGSDTEDGRYVTEKIVKHFAGFLKYAWDGKSSEFKKIMKDGTDISTFIPNRNGYYGNFYKREKPFGSYSAGKLFMWAACAAYRAAAARPDLKNEADIIRGAIDYFAENVYGFGKIGGAEIGDSEMQLNYNTDDAGAYHVICLTDLYLATGKTEFLDLARVVAKNMIDEYYKYGFFLNKTGIGTEPGKYYNIALGSASTQYYYALAYLEGAIHGDRSIVPRTLMFDGYYQDNYVYENNNISRVMDTVWWYLADEKVLVSDIVFDRETVALKTGEKQTLQYTVLPKDATDKSVSFWFTDNSVAKIDRKNGTITGLSPGETDLLCVSSDLNVAKTLHIIVE